MKQSKDIVKDFQIEQFQHDLISWFETEQRILPWRQDQDPYKVWVSEIMLQQTRVDTVIPYFNNFIEKFPTIVDLAYAPEDDVLKAWEGLGYYSRARNLQAAVREVHEQYGGKVPHTPDEISKLKGVGPYTTGAILSIAYGVPQPAVDGNVMRVLSRILSIWDDIAKPKTRKVFEEVVHEIISKDSPSFFNQGLMELGAIVCTPTSPSCLLCPVREHCRAFEQGVQQELPVKSKKKPPRAVQIAAAVVTDEQGNFLIHKRPNKGLLANLWEFPNVEVDLTIGTEQTQLTSFVEADYDTEVVLDHPFTVIQHVFSHIVWNINVYKGVLTGNIANRDDLKLVSVKEIEEYAFPVSHQKILKEYHKIT
ncbi:A/G-specific adenine glycosylase [Bacillus sp. VT 712]|uniref:A/G-specific adenine glycosylase n=1 Tax=Bacillaceae TaxID=186817 RepID=UPI00047413DB|nr:MULTISPECIES: A/G-specific adenine glycosylase [Bacillaceae]KZB90308.1 A/G-specific adenine glycosylase [Bacillus sp. VT 712]SCC16098.1 A/G-specific DNA-adenine glycosylase [Priestia flexa]